MERDSMKAAMQQVNDLELMYRDKQETFWQRMFMGCTGFVAVIVPLATQIDMTRCTRMCLFGAVAAVLVCILCIIPLLYCSVRWHRKLFEHGKKVAKGETSELEFSPAEMTRLERGCVVIAILAIIAAMLCLSCAILF